MSCPVCHCAACTCGPDCQCTEALCRCQASSFLDSLGKGQAQHRLAASPNSTTGACCSQSLTNSPGRGASRTASAEVVRDPLARASGTDELVPTVTSESSLHAVLEIRGMTCSMCAQAIEVKLRSVPGVTEVAINLTTDTATVAFRPRDSETKGRLEELTGAIEDAGYEVVTARLMNCENGSSEPRGKAELVIQGMTCSMCVQAIENVVRQDLPNTTIAIHLSTDTAVVDWDTTKYSLETIQETIESIGYTVTSANELPENNSTESTSMEESWEHFTRRQEAKVQAQRRAFLSSLAGTLPILLFTMVFPHILPSHTFLNRHISIWGYDLEWQALILWILATPVQFITGWGFYKHAYFGIMSGKAGMDVLVALGTTASYGYALEGLLTGDDEAAHFFETSAVLICFVLAGKWMQVLAVRRTSEALTALMKLQSKTAVKITPGNKVSSASFNPLFDPYHEAVVPIQEVHAGDMVKIIRGASIPADGNVLFGEVSVDESMVTGESVPVLKGPGSVVLGGTVCVESSSTVAGDELAENANDQAVGAAFVEVTGVGSSTALAQIVQLVQEAQTRSVPIQSFADRISGIFVPTVCTISLLTYMVWYALCSSKVVPASWYDDLGESMTTFSLKFAIACLVISCPCALGLATPTAVMVGTGVGAKLGVLMKGGEALEVASKVNSVVFDKTGTLTQGKPAITDFVRLDEENPNDWPEDDLLWMLASLERTSEHPLANAVVSYAEEHLSVDYLEQHPFTQPSNFRAITGRGASGVVQGTSVAVGNRSFANVLNISVPAQAEAVMKRLEEQGKTAILAAFNDHAYVVMGIADELKSDAAASLSYLKNTLGVDIWMVTGDNSRTAKAISRKLGLAPNRVISEALPAAKVQKVRQLQAEGRVVAMVGDGVNDSPALAQADVGMSVGTGADIAAEASDMVLVKAHVTDVCVALHLSRVIFRRIQLNLLLSLVYNCLGIPIAAGLFYPYVRTRLPPTVAALAMALSSISVVLSSLSLQLYQPPTLAGRQMRRRSSPLVAWASSRPHGSTHETTDGVEENDLTVDLLSNDRLGGNLDNTDSTREVDNRSSVELEEGKGGSVDE